MAPNRLSALDASFLDVETASAHMHVGWAAAFDPPEERPAPASSSFVTTSGAACIARPATEAPRRRALGVARPAWVDDDRFDVTRHVRPADTASLTELTGSVLSTPLSRERPLWELWIADRLDDGRIGVVGKAHHCMVDGIAAVELATVLLDPEARPASRTRRTTGAGETPGGARRFVDGLVDTARDQLSLAGSVAGVVGSPRKLAAGAQRAGTALLNSLSPATPWRCSTGRSRPTARSPRSRAPWMTCERSSTPTAA